MILIIDTSSDKIRLAFGEEDSARKSETKSEKQSAVLPGLVAELLGGARSDAIGVIVGPGSFTGIRLGIAFAKGLAMGWSVPVVGINIFELASVEQGGAAPAYAINSGRGDYFIAENNTYGIAAKLPANARLITECNPADGIRIVKKKLESAAKNSAPYAEPVIPLYIRPSYVDSK